MADISIPQEQDYYRVTYHHEHGARTGRYDNRLDLAQVEYACRTYGDEVAKIERIRVTVKAEEYVWLPNVGRAVLK